MKGTVNECEVTWNECECIHCIENTCTKFVENVPVNFKLRCNTIKLYAEIKFNPRTI